MAQAVQELFPQARLGMGPPIKDGFSYDFDVDRPFQPEDLERIEDPAFPTRALPTTNWSTMPSGSSCSGRSGTTGTRTARRTIT